MILAVNLFINSGFLDFVLNLLRPAFNMIKFPAEVFPLAIVRPISGSASISVFSSICNDYGPDSLVCKVGSVIQGSTDTTIYVLALYFSSVGITKWKHALKAGLIADVVGIGMGVFLSIVFLGF